MRFVYFLPLLILFILTPAFAYNSGFRPVYQPPPPPGGISSIHDIGNVTSVGCAVGQLLAVNGSAIWACIDGGSGEVNTQSSPTHANTLVLTKSGVDLPIKGIACSGSVVCSSNSTDITLTGTNPLVVIKSTNETITSDSTLSNDSELFFTANANTMYRVEYMIFFQSETVSDMKYDFTIPSGNYTRISGMWSGNQNPFPNTSPTGQSMVTSGSKQGMMIAVLFDIGDTGGQVSFQWAQLLSDPSSTTVTKGSSMVVYKAT